MAFDDIVNDAKGVEVALAMEAEQTFFSRRRRGTSDDVVVSHGEMAVRLVDPDHAAARIADQVIVKDSRAFGGRFAEAGNQIADILFSVKVEQIMIDLNAVAHDLNRVTMSKVVVMNSKGAAAFGHGAASVFRNGDRPVADVVVDLDVFVVSQ